MTDTKKNFLTVDGIKLFISANILHAIDHNLLNMKFSDIKINVDTEYEGNKYVIKIEHKKKEIGTLFFPLESSSIENQYRAMMGSAMSTLEILSVFAQQQKPVLKIVK